MLQGVTPEQEVKNEGMGVRRWRGGEGKGRTEGQVGGGGNREGMTACRLR